MGGGWGGSEKMLTSENLSRVFFKIFDTGVGCFFRSLHVCLKNFLKRSVFVEGTV